MVKAMSIAVMIFLGLIAPLTTNAQSDGFFRYNEDTYDNRDANINIWTATNGIQNDDFGESPLGSGLLILTAAGAGYVISRRRRSRKNASNASKTALLLAIAILLGISSCKKKTVEPIAPSGGNQVAITLNVGGGSKAEVDPPHVSFKTGDQILVAYDGKYVGTITHNGTYFNGNIDATGDNTKPLYFYFLGNKDAGTLTAGTTTSCTVNISDQTGYPTLPVISFSASDQNFNGAGSYTASLHNKCSLMKFNVRTRSNSPIYITGMNNQVTIDFSKAASDGDNNGFTYDKEGNGIIMLKGGRGFPVEKWAIVLPQPELNAGHLGSTYAKNGSYTTFRGSRPKIHAIETNQYYHEGDDDIDLEVNTATDIVDLGDIIANKIIKTGETVIGTLAVNMQISIDAGATVTLCDVNINGSGTWSTGNYAGLNCLGDATIILADGTTNIVKGFNVDYPGIHVPSGSTLTIRGTGSLNASSNGWGAGIGGGYKGDNTINCGNIIISGGTVTATGGGFAAGIGSGGNGCSCGTITISGGTVTATGGQYAAGIGSGFNESSCGAITISGGTVEATGGNDGEYGNAGVGIGSSDLSSCGAITIQNTVTRVTATKGGSSATNSIGAGNNGTCGTVTIGGVVGAITTSPYTYPVPVPTGAINGKFTINLSGDQVYFSQGNLQAVGTTSSSPSSGWTWQFAEHQWDYIGGRSQGGSEPQTGNNYINGNGTLSADGAVDLFCWSTNATYYGIHNSDDASTYSGAFYDWGNAIGDDWRTLTNAEWEWIMGPSGSPTPGTNCRTSSTVNGVENARYAKATVADKTGLIIFPDSYTHPGDVTAPASVNTAGAAYTVNSYDATAWGKMEAAGAVFLPATGSRNTATDNSVQGCGVIGGYWSSVVHSDDNAYCLAFQPSDIGPSAFNPKRFGASVRLVKDAN